MYQIYSTGFNIVIHFFTLCFNVLNKQFSITILRFGITFFAIFFFYSLIFFNFGQNGPIWNEKRPKLKTGSIGRSLVNYYFFPLWHCVLGRSDSDVVIFRALGAPNPNRCHTAPEFSIRKQILRLRRNYRKTFFHLDKNTRLVHVHSI